MSADRDPRIVSDPRKPATARAGRIAAGRMAADRIAAGLAAARSGLPATIAALAVVVLAAVAVTAVLDGAEAAVTLGLAGWLPVAIAAIAVGGGGSGLKRRMIRGYGFTAVLPLLPLAVGVALASRGSL
ncbi:hypothetical protein PJ900_06575 [Tistrella mobilis]|nr:hypothetical protein [Tistrella mobilis]